MKVITVINDKNSMGFRMLRLSCLFQQLDLVALVWNDSEFESFRLKDILLKDYLEKLSDAGEVVIFSDGIDAVFMAGEEELLAKFRDSGKDLIFSTESNCYPDRTYVDRYPASAETQYKYLNSGGFIGKVGTIREMLADDSIDCSAFQKSNQYVWMMKYFKYPDRICIDTKCAIFQTFSPEYGWQPRPGDSGPLLPEEYYRRMKEWFLENFRISKGRIYSRISETWPCQAHFNGLSKVLIDDDVIDMVMNMGVNFKPVEFIYSGGSHRLSGS
jgi:hypothetical protein